MEGNNATPKSIDIKTITWAVYIGWGAGVLSSAVHLFGMLPLIAAMVAYLKRQDAAGTIYESHLTWVFRSFIIALVSVVGVMVLMVIPPIGMLAMGALTLWCLYRLVKGGLRLMEGKPVENPTAFI